ncbi:MAG: hypothetical protein H6595_00425 [Flavobacteriales bacterium]|nr:hypothetical protein [Flavobacteriales bacterium]MCB9165923.1 hypothetical protein [Flavobacteriales bacterium]
MMRKPLLLAAAVLALAACRKEQAEVDRDYTSAVDDNLAENFFNDALKQADMAADENGLRDALDNCIDSIAFDTVSMPHTLYIDFGTDDCTGSDGRRRRGALLVTFTGPYRAEGTVITITTVDYHVNDYLVEGTKTVTNMGANSDGDPYFSVQVDGTVTAPNGDWTAEHHATRTRTWIAGEDTATPWDDVYLITGSGNGVNRNGLSYTLSITTALRIEIGCPYIVSGKLEITPGSLPTRYVDFGVGSCDATVSVTVNGVVFYFN